MATVTPYKDGRYRAVVRRAGFKARTKVFQKKSDAERWIRTTESELDKVGYQDPHASVKITVRELFERALKELVPTRKSRSEKNRVERIIRDADFVLKRLDKLTSKDIQAWRDKRIKEVSPDSVNRELNTISGIFTHAIKEWHIGLPANPVRLVVRPKGGNHSRSARWTDDHIRALLLAAGWSQDLVNKAMAGEDLTGVPAPTNGKQAMPWIILVALETAMRPSELSALQVRDFLPDECCLRLHTSKIEEGRDVPLSSKALKYAHLVAGGRNPNAPLFFIGWESMGVYYRDLRTAAGLGELDLRFRDFRHEGTTRMSKKFSNVLELSAVTGHKKLDTLRRYYNPTAAELAARLG